MYGPEWVPPSVTNFTTNGRSLRGGRGDLREYISHLLTLTWSAVCWGSENTCSLELFNKINVRDDQGLHYTRQTFGGHRVTSPSAVRVHLEVGVLLEGPWRSPLSAPNLFDQQTEHLCEGEGGTRAKISQLLTLRDLVPLLILPTIRTKVADMGGDDDGKWFVAGGRSRAKKCHDATNSKGGTKAVDAGAVTSRGGAKKCFNSRGVGHLQHQCPSRAGATSSRGKQAAGSHYGSSSNVSTAASTSSGGKKPPPLRKHPRAGPSRGGGQPGSQATSTSGATTTGRKRARDPTMTSGFTPPNKQATGSTRFSYVVAEEGGERVVLVSLDGTALTKEDPRLLGEAVKRRTLNALTKKEFHNVPEVLDAKPTKLGLEVRVRDSKSAHLVRVCVAKVNLRALMVEELAVLERPLRRYNGFMRGDANASLFKEAMQLMVDGQRHLRGIEGRMMVDRLIRTQQAHMGKGRGTGGDAHRLTPQNIVPLPIAKFDPLNREKLKFSVATPSLSPKNRINIGRFFCFFHVLKRIFLLTVSFRHENFLFTPSLPIP